MAATPTPTVLEGVIALRKAHPNEAKMQGERLKQRDIVTAALIDHLGMTS